MSGTMTAGKRPTSRRRLFRLERAPGLEIVVLAPLAAVLVLWLIPSLFQVEWACAGPLAAARTPGDTYIATITVLGTVGWLIVLPATLLASVTGSHRMAAILPLAWFAALVVGATIWAASIGPQLCSGLGM